MPVPCIACLLPLLSRLCPHPALPCPNALYVLSSSVHLTGVRASRQEGKRHRRQRAAGSGARGEREQERRVSAHKGTGGSKVQGLPQQAALQPPNTLAPAAAHAASQRLPAVRAQRVPAAVAPPQGSAGAQARLARLDGGIVLKLHEEHGLGARLARHRHIMRRHPAGRGGVVAAGGWSGGDGKRAWYDGWSGTQGSRAASTQRSRQPAGARRGARTARGSRRRRARRARCPPRRRRG